MARKIVPQSRFQGISYSDKEGLTSSFLFAQSMDYRTDPTKLKILPRATKVSGSVVQDLILDAARVETETYGYGDAGHIYRRASDDTWTDLKTIASSHGNGMAYFGEDKFLYYTSDRVIGRYGPFGGTKNFADDFLGAEGGVPLNTASLSLNGTSQYVTAADDASLSQAGDISMEIYTKLNSLPGVGESKVFMSKWNRNADQRSFLFELYGISGYFGDDAEGALTVAANTTQAPTDSSCTGTAASYAISATNASFAVGQKVYIHQTMGTNAGVWERNEIAGYTAGTVTLSNPLQNNYNSAGSNKAQIIVFPEYSSITINAGVTWRAKAWNGSVGGILVYLCSGTVTVNGTMSAAGANGSMAAIGAMGGTVAGGSSGCGFRGGAGLRGRGASTYSYDGEGTAGPSAANGIAPNGNGGGGARGSENGVGGAGGGSGAGGGHATAGQVFSGWSYGDGIQGQAGLAYGTPDLNVLAVFGGGGGGGITDNSGNVGSGGQGGGGIVGTSTNLTIHATTGTITAAGGNGGNGSYGMGGAGAGGFVILKVQTATLNTNRISVAGGTGGLYNSVIDYGGDGAVGRIHMDYYTSYTGTTSPTLNTTQDDTLVTTTSYQLRLGISTDGAAEEFLTKTLQTNPNLNQWNRWQVAWDASAATAFFYQNGTLLGQSTGTLTAIYDGTALFAIGAKFNAAGAAEGFLDGKADDVRFFSDLRTQSELEKNLDVHIPGATTALQGYWKVNSTTADDSANTNTLTLVDSATYDTTDVPFSSPTARNDLDQSLDTNGNTYTVPAAIDEGATARQSFVPEKDPQKSIEVLFAGKGTGNVTLTVHDGLNRVVATKTITNAELPASGDVEFEFDEEWRPILGATYHFHLTSTVADATVTTTTNADLETVDFHTYYQFLVTSENHPIEHHAEKLNIGNGRYLATWNGISYDPHRLTLPSGFEIRCQGQWREYLVMGVVRGSTIDDFEKGYLVFWDGYSDTYNYIMEIKEGGINSIVSGDPLYFVAGYSGDLMKYAGGNPVKIRRMPFVESKDILLMNRNSLATWRSLLHLGFSSSLLTQTFLADNFNDDDINDDLWIEYEAGGATLDEQNERVEIAFPSSSTSLTDGDLTSVNFIPFTENFVSMEVVEVPDSGTNANGEIRLYVDRDNWIRWVYEAGTIYAQKKVAGATTTVDSVVYVAATHKYWRLRISDGTIYYETSPDNFNWTALTTTTVTFSTESMRILIAGTCYQNETDPGNFIVDNLKSDISLSNNINTTAENIKRGVYSWGTLHAELPETLSFDYPISSGKVNDSSVEIGMIFPVGSNLLISWRNGSTFGVDVVKPSNPLYAEASIDFLITDVNKIWAEKQMNYIRGYFKAIESGDTMQFRYKRDRQSAWVEGDVIDTEGVVEGRLPMPTKKSRFNEYQLGLVMTTTNEESPEFYGWGGDYDDLQRERRT